jgi:hypothetical protein
LHAVQHKNTHRKEQIILATSLSLRASCGCHHNSEK